ncbi:MAG TPA: protein-tyrosine phosphatase family protein [Tepidiformaceae bacterium]|nr:protein-tyrosine phosphatase family protein [Tepidiformaceae bacterium]
MLEEPFTRNNGSSSHPPRASLVLAAGEAGNPATEVWMGGAHSLVGETLDHPVLSRSWVIDCAGDMPASLRTSAGLWVSCVFSDIDGPLSPSLRLDDVVERVLSAVRTPKSAPERVYVMCTHGMNRSGLVAGLLLRSFGVEGVEAVDRIRLARPGALSNQHFRNMILYP